MIFIVVVICKHNIQKDNISDNLFKLHYIFLLFFFLNPFFLYIYNIYIYVVLKVVIRYMNAFTRSHALLFNVLLCILNKNFIHT